MTKASAGALAVTMGEPAGIGGEIALMAWLKRDRVGCPAFFMIDSPKRLMALAALLGLDLPIAEIEAPEEAVGLFASALPVYPIDLASEVAPGQPDPANARAVLSSIDTACALVHAGRAAALVTNPINKQVLYAAGFTHPGHTEYLAALLKSASAPVMMLACPGLRVVPVTVHLPLARAIAQLSEAQILHCGRVTARALSESFGLAEPRLAVAGLNPHAGERGTLGREEIEVIAPAVARLRAEGFSIEDPAPADSLFHPAARRRYDAVLCMYHDQALIPLKTIDFQHGVNITLGLPVIRTSPDHGTAFGIAGRGEADSSSLIEALKTAYAMAETRSAAETAVTAP